VPLLVLLVVGALLLGSVGPATAAGVTKRTVKKIATKVVSQQAPKLSVAHAATADTATNAGTANQLGGAAAAAYRDYGVRIAVASDTVVNAGIGQVGGAETLHVPAGIAYLEVSVSASFSGGNTTVTVWHELDTVCGDASTSYPFRPRGHTSVPESVASTLLVPVTPGDHTIRLCRSVGGTTTQHAASLVAVTVAQAAD